MSACRVCACHLDLAACSSPSCLRLLFRRVVLGLSALNVKVRHDRVLRSNTDHLATDCLVGRSGMSACTCLRLPGLLMDRASSGSSRRRSSAQPCSLPLNWNSEVSFSSSVSRGWAFGRGVSFPVFILFLWQSTSFKATCICIFWQELLRVMKIEMEQAICALLIVSSVLYNCLWDEIRCCMISLFIWTHDSLYASFMVIRSIYVLLSTLWQHFSHLWHEMISLLSSCFARVFSNFSRSYDCIYTYAFTACVLRCVLYGTWMLWCFSNTGSSVEGEKTCFMISLMFFYDVRYCSSWHREHASLLA